MSTLPAPSSPPLPPHLSPHLSHPSAFLPDYAELHCQSNFTFLHGASHPEELVQRAIELGYTSLAITDECSLAGVVRAYVQIQKHDESEKDKPKEERTSLHLIIGSEITFDCGTRFVFLAKDINGYGNLSELITLGRRRADKGFYTLYRSDLEVPAKQKHDQPHLAHLEDCIALLIPQRAHTREQIAEQAAWAAHTFGHDRTWIAVELLHWVDDAYWLEQLSAIAVENALPMVAAGDVLMHVRSRKPLQDTLTAVRLGKTIADCGLDLQPNAEQHLRSRMRLAQIYAPPLLKATLDIASQCIFSLQEISYQYPKEIVPEGETISGYLRRLTYEGAANYRYKKVGTIPADVREKIERELQLIAELKYEPFFLTVYDIVKFARSQRILCQGRGSAANSVVCYCLGITEVNPEQCSVLFERFVSRERNEPPDIDVDFEHQRREEVMQYIYTKYGRHRAAIAASLITYRPRSAMKDVGKALGLDFEQVNRLSSSHKWWDGREVREERLRECGFDPQSSVVQKLVELTETLIGFRVICRNTSVVLSLRKTTYPGWFRSRMHR